MRRNRILLKLSGEILSGRGGFGIDSARTLAFAERLQRAMSGCAVQLALVVGGGNVLRGARFAGSGVDRVTGDAMGMLATVLNGLALQSCFESLGVGCSLLSAIPTGTLTEPFSHRSAILHLEKGRIVVLVGGTGHPFFTTDTTAALRALEIGAGLLAKGTKVRGVFTEDPVENPAASFLPRLSYEELLEKRLEIMDATAVTLCREHGLPIRVFDVWEEESLEKLLRGEDVGSLVS
ncbi:MAG: UMP kinase [Planctomycetes bacterium]|nr:UMP kinase [Planctomycetota bacterium]